MLEDTAAIARAETEIDAFIQRRVRERSKVNGLAEVELREERAYRAKKQKAIRAEWYEHFRRMADSHRELAEDYERRAARLGESAS